MPNDLATSSPQDIESSLVARQDDLAALLAGSMDTEKFIKIATMLAKGASGRLREAITQYPGLFMLCVHQAATLGLSLDPILGEFYVVPRRSKAHSNRSIPTSIVGYIGLVKRVRRIESVVNVRAGVVRKGDMFEVEDGTAPMIVHRPIQSSEPRDVLAAWACIDVREAPPLIAVVDSWAIEQARGRSDSGKNDKGPWWTDYGPMAQKTALRRACKLAPLDDATREAVVNEERIESETVVTQVGEPPGYQGIDAALDTEATDGQE